MKPYHECPSFNRCSANVCPLDPEINLRNSIPEDELCKAEKPSRFKIGVKYPEVLIYQGLTKREWTGRRLWNDKTPEQREFITQRLSKLRKTSKKGIVEGLNGNS